jgi:hypothetical protein
MKKLFLLVCLLKLAFDASSAIAALSPAKRARIEAMPEDHKSADAESHELESDEEDYDFFKAVKDTKRYFGDRIEFQFDDSDYDAEFDNLRLDYKARFDDEESILTLVMQWEAQELLVRWTIYKLIEKEPRQVIGSSAASGRFTLRDVGMHDENFIDSYLEGFVGNYFARLDVREIRETMYPCSGCQRKIAQKLPNGDIVVARRGYFICGHILCENCIAKWERKQRGYERTCPVDGCSIELYIPTDSIATGKVTMR